MSLLSRLGGEVHWYDPQVSTLHGQVRAEKLETVDADILAGFDVAVIVTAHGGIDYAQLVDSCPALVDTRKALKAFDSKKIYKL